ATTAGRSGSAGRTARRVSQHRQPGKRRRRCRCQQPGITLHQRIPAGIRHRNRDRSHRNGGSGLDIRCRHRVVRQASDAVDAGGGGVMNIYVETWNWFTDPVHWSGVYGIPHRLFEHVEYTLLTVVLAAAIAVPLGLWIGHTGRFRQIAVSGTGEIGGLATCGLPYLVVVLQSVNMSAVNNALVVLAVPTGLAGPYSGLESVNPQTNHSARAMGMTEWQTLTRVEVPLAMP